jgi:2-amino-4-hydroxy-6-hydroxymethyldihydropteridine diphosphokinase
MKAYLGIGSNMGDRSSNLKKAIELIGRSIEINNQSSVYESEPVGYKNQANFFNMVLEVETNISADQLLELAKDVEKEIGRKLTFKDGPRVIDVDILLYGNLEVKSDKLILPHPRMTERAFVLKPLLEIAPNLEMPDGKKLKDIKMPKQKVKQLK